MLVAVVGSIGVKLTLTIQENNIHDRNSGLTDRFVWRVQSGMSILGSVIKTFLGEYL